MTEHWTGWKLAACWVLAVVGCWIVVVGALIGIYDGLIAMRDLARPCTAVPYAIDERPKCVRVGRKRQIGRAHV